MLNRDWSLSIRPKPAYAEAAVNGARPHVFLLASRSWQEQHPFRHGGLAFDGGTTPKEREQVPSVFKGSEVPMLILDPDTALVVEANSRAESFYGFEAGGMERHSHFGFERP